MVKKNVHWFKLFFLIKFFIRMNLLVWIYNVVCVKLKEGNLKELFVNYSYQK